MRILSLTLIFTFAATVRLRCSYGTAAVDGYAQYMSVYDQVCVKHRYGIRQGSLCHRGRRKGVCAVGTNYSQGVRTDRKIHISAATVNHIIIIIIITFMWKYEYSRTSKS